MTRRSRRHGRRPIRSSLTGPFLPDPDGRVTRFEVHARAAVEDLRALLGTELEGVRIGFETAPRGTGESAMPLFYSIHRDERAIILHRMPIQQAKGLHVEDDYHRRLFVEHCVYRAVCEYLGRDPWDLFPERYGHF